jgi:hypothetical protein
MPGMHISYSKVEKKFSVHRGFTRRSLPWTAYNLRQIAAFFSMQQDTEAELQVNGFLQLLDTCRGSKMAR